jgi:hypothetical protein
MKDAIVLSDNAMAKANFYTNIYDGEIRLKELSFIYINTFNYGKLKLTREEANNLLGFISEKLGEEIHT